MDWFIRWMIKKYSKQNNMVYIFYKSGDADNSISRFMLLGKIHLYLVENWLVTWYRMALYGNRYIIKR